MDFEDVILDSLDSIGGFDFAFLIKLVVASAVVFWFFVVFWVWTDSRERSTNFLFSIVSVLLVAPFNVLGLIVYLLIRPRETIESLFWSDLERRYLINETADLGDCKECGYQLSPEFNACPQCATPNKVECPSCQSMVRTDWKFCPVCSHQLLTRRVPEKEITQAVMEKNLEDTREQAYEAVENNRIRYKSRGSILAKLGRPLARTIIAVGSSVDSILRAIGSAISLKSKRLKKRALANRGVNYSTSFAEISENSAVNDEFQQGGKKSKKKKKKRRRR